MHTILAKYSFNNRADIYSKADFGYFSLSLCDCCRVQGTLKDLDVFFTYSFSSFSLNISYKPVVSQIKTHTHSLLLRNTHLSLGFGVLRTLSSSSSSGPLSLGFSNSTLSRSRSSSSTSGGGSAGSCSESSTFRYGNTHKRRRYIFSSSAAPQRSHKRKVNSQSNTRQKHPPHLKL